MKEQLSIITQMFESLSSEDKEGFLAYLNGKPNTKPITFFTSLEDLVKKHNNSEKPNCPHCNSSVIVKNGHKRNVQRFICRECNKSFTLTTNTILYSSKKDFATWLKFCECLMNKFSIRKSAEVCNINPHTAFDWRHKILDALQNMQTEVKLDGIVQSDETYFSISYKGKKSDMPRESRHRGYMTTTRGISQDLTCVPCTVNLNGKSVGMISNLGKPTTQNLEKAFGSRIEKGSILVTDSLRAYQKVAHENELTHIRIAKGKRSNGSFNIQTINSYHSELKRMVIGNFKGVSTKYLNNYIVYHNLVNFSKDNDKTSILDDFVFTTKCKTKGYEIVNRNPVPVL